MESDQRTGGIDFEKLILFGNTNNITQLVSQKLIMDYLEVMEDYIKHLTEEFKDRKVFSTLDIIIQKANNKGGSNS